MLITPTREGLNKIVVLNSKGGCGKTTLTTTLASHYAMRGPMPAMMDCDPQGSSMRWLEKRPNELAPIHGIAAYKKNVNATRSWQLRIPDETETLIIDSPAGLDQEDLRQLTRDATSLLVPVMPSAIDIHAAARFIADLLLIAKVRRSDRKLAVVANRTRQNTKSLERLMRFLNSLDIPVIGVLRDSQNFVHAAEAGIGIYEMKRYRVARDVEEFDRIVGWLDSWRTRKQAPAPVAEEKPQTPTNVTWLRPPHSR